MKDDFSRVNNFMMEFVVPFLLLASVACTPLIGLRLALRWSPSVAQAVAAHGSLRVAAFYCAHTWLFFFAIVSGVVFVCGRLQALALLRIFAGSRRAGRALA